MKTFNISIDMLDESGLNAIALVKDPAVDYDFLAFSEGSVLQFQDEEKHIITGVSLLADTPILRVNSEGERYCVVFSKETIRQLVEKYSKLNLNNEVNIQHNSSKFVDGVTMIESYIVDRERGICPVEFSSVPDGSWITSFKVNNPEVWAKVKSGEIKGFSVQGIFGLKEKLNFEDADAEVLDLINKLKNKIKKFN